MNLYLQLTAGIGPSTGVGLGSPTYGIGVGFHFTYL